MRALVVDDSRAMRSIVGRIVRGLGFEIVEAGNGVEALERLRGGAKIDLAMIDWNMPEMNGLELVKSIRAESRWDSMKLVMVTTESEVENVAQALGAGANEYVMKPFTPDVLCDKLALIGITLEVAHAVG